jgi:alpha-beta hydrolase superfamily lysophospholipase
MMRVATNDLDNPEILTEPAPRARPVCFDGLAGLYHAAAGDIAVLLISPWGFEELCSRLTYRVLGERFAALGYPCLRFDLPGTGHSTYSSSEIDDEGAWRRALCSAYDHLRSLTQARKIVIVGQGLGGLLAADLAQQRSVDGLVLLAPALQGRGHLREIAAWTAMTKGEFKVSSTDGPPGGFMSAGFVLSAATVNEIRQLKPLGSLPAVVQQVFLARRPGNAGDAQLAEELSANGIAIEGIDFIDHAAYVDSPIFSVIPEDTLEKVLSWMGAHFPVTADLAVPTPPVPATARLEGDGYVEECVRFGPSDMLFGVFTAPTQGKDGKTAVLILNTGADHSVGWGRYSVDLARVFARQGFAAMRIDNAGIGETPLWHGQERPVMYSPRANDDVRCAIDWMVAKAGIERVVLLGRCSGGYPAFVSAVADTRVGASVVINLPKLHWEPGEDILKALRDPVEPIDTYSQGLRSTRHFKRILSGELKISTILRKLSKTLVAIAARKLAPLFGDRSRHHRIGRIVRERLQALTARKVPVALIYSAGDPGLHDLFGWAGPQGTKLAAHPNVELHVIEGADHNLSPLPVRAEVTDLIIRFMKDKVCLSRSKT